MGWRSESQEAVSTACWRLRVKARPNRETVNYHELPSVSDMLKKERGEAEKVVLQAVARHNARLRVADLKRLCGVVK
jgi:hypothetical protein